MQMPSHNMTMAAAPQLINIGNAGNTHHDFLPNRLVMGCYFSARRDTIDHIENTEHNYNGFPRGLMLKPNNIWGGWEEAEGLMDQSSSRHFAGSPVSVLWLRPRHCQWPSALPFQLSTVAVTSQNVPRVVHACSNLIAPKSCVVVR